jgi:hypothetical protein
LCEEHAVAAGSKQTARAGSSHAGCEALHVFAQQTGLTVIPNTHVHYEPGKPSVGGEVPVIKHDHRSCTDGILSVPPASQLLDQQFSRLKTRYLLFQVRALRSLTSIVSAITDLQRCRMRVAQFQGNHVHGHKQGHWRHRTFGLGHRWGIDMQNNTRRRKELFITSRNMCGPDGVALNEDDGYAYVEVCEDGPLTGPNHTDPLHSCAQVWENDWRDYLAELKTNSKAQLKFDLTERNTLLPMDEASKKARDLPCNKPEGEHISGGGCLTCAAPLISAKAERAASTAAVRAGRLTSHLSLPASPLAKHGTPLAERLALLLNSHDLRVHSKQAGDSDGLFLKTLVNEIIGKIERNDQQQAKKAALAAAIAAAEDAGAGSQAAPTRECATNARLPPLFLVSWCALVRSGRRR